MYRHARITGRESGSHNTYTRNFFAFILVVDSNSQYTPVNRWYIDGVFRNLMTR